jgi:hypothetical protein
MHFRKTEYQNIDQGCTNLPKSTEAVCKLLVTEGSLEAFCTEAPKNVRRHRKKFVRRGDLAPSICAPLIERTIIWQFLCLIELRDLCVWVSGNKLFGKKLRV